MNESDKLLKNERVTGARFVRRMYLMRTLGTLLCFFPVLSVLVELDRPLWLLVLLAVNAFIWPMVAYLRAKNAPMPLDKEHHNLIFDTAAGGFWIAMMAVNLLPSVVIATILMSDRVSAGGFPLLRKAAAVMLAAFAITWLALGFPFAPVVSQKTLYATLPLIAIYVFALSVLTNSIARKLRKNSRELERIAMMDPLLDIANRRLLERRIEFELIKLRHNSHSSALMFIDIDNFKEVNDRYGHEVGDSLLVTVSQILHVATRKTDTPARLGGDEFVILLPETVDDEAKNIARRIMEAVSVMTVLPDNTLSLTLSIGIAQATKEMISSTDWLKAADDALYQAKREGKNRIYAH